MSPIAGRSVRHGAFQSDNVAAAQLAVDGKVEHRQVACPPLDLELRSYRPHVLWPQRRLRPDQFALVPRRALN